MADLVVEAVGHESQALNFIRQMKGLGVNPKLMASFTVGVPTADFRRTAKLRSAEDIGRARDLAARWHGRARTRQLGEGDDPQVERVDLDADVTAAAVERHYALNWLCGYASDWDSVPTDT
jgi:hypothetical protein